jgi:serine/threonine protein phosphatase 1
MKTFSRSRKKDRPNPHFAPDCVGFAIGDIHGRADLLELMLERIEAEAMEAASKPPVVIFLGDYIDRGPESRRVLDILTSGRPFGFDKVFLKGNHEAAMLGFLEDPAQGKAWFAYGGLDTLTSYGIAPPALSASPADLERARDGLAAALPEGHLTFLRGLELKHIAGDYLFVHAGVDPKRPIDQQTERDLLWIRGGLIDGDQGFSHCVVHGHTPGKDVYRDAHRIGLDTGAYATGRLSAARFQSETVEFLTVTR